MAENVIRTSARGRQGGRLARGLLAVGHVVNPLLLPLANTGLVPIWGVVRHRGRKSGRGYETPIAVLATADGFLIPLPFGERTDWCRNLLAAGSGIVRWKRGEYAVSELAIVETRDALPIVGPVLRALIPAFGIKHFLRARRARIGANART